MDMILNIHSNKLITSIFECCEYGKAKYNIIYNASYKWSPIYYTLSECHIRLVNIEYKITVQVTFVHE